MKNSHLNRTLLTVIHRLVSKALIYLKVPVIGMRGRSQLDLVTSWLVRNMFKKIADVHVKFCNTAFSNITAVNVGTFSLLLS